MIMRTHKIKLNPTPTQERLLAQHAAYARAAYNWALRCYKDGKAAGQEPTQDELHRGPALGKCRGAETDHCLSFQPSEFPSLLVRNSAGWKEWLPHHQDVGHEVTEVSG